MHWCSLLVFIGHWLFRIFTVKVNICPIPGDLFFREEGSDISALGSDKWLVYYHTEYKLNKILAIFEKTYWKIHFQVFYVIIIIFQDVLQTPLNTIKGTMFKIITEVVHYLLLFCPNPHLKPKIWSKCSLFSTYFPTHGLNSFISSNDGFTPSSFLKSANGKGKCMMHLLYKANPHKTPNCKYLCVSCVACWWESKSISIITALLNIGY